MYIVYTKFTLNLVFRIEKLLLLNFSRSMDPTHIWYPHTTILISLQGRVPWPRRYWNRYCISQIFKGYPLVSATSRSFTQDSYWYWKTWKVLEKQKSKTQARKTWKVSICPWKFWKVNPFLGKSINILLFLSCILKFLNMAKNKL